MSRIEQLAPPGTRTLRLVTGHRSRSNLAFYAHRGYHEVERRDDAPGPPVVVLEKPLRTT